MFYSSLYKRNIDWSVRWSGIYFLILLDVFVFNLVTENICSAREVYESSLLLTIDFQTISTASGGGEGLLLFFSQCTQFKFVSIVTLALDTW